MQLLIRKGRVYLPHCITVVNVSKEYIRNIYPQNFFVSLLQSQISYTTYFYFQCQLYIKIYYLLFEGIHQYTFERRDDNDNKTKKKMLIINRRLRALTTFFSQTSRMKQARLKQYQLATGSTPQSTDNYHHCPFSHLTMI